MKTVDKKNAELDALNLGAFTSLEPAGDIILEGSFTAEELRAILDIMEGE